jgi:hypothetical protein
MRKKAEFWFLVAGLVVLSAIFAGCSGEASQVTPVPTTTPIGPKFVAGDIIAKTASSTDTFWLIVKYDAKTDKYERALAYKKSDGSWYRKDAKTELYDRAQTEKLYPAKVTHVSSISAVPVVTPTTIPVTTSATATATTAPLAAPTVTGITPGSGMAGATVNITTLTGTNFRTGVIVRLVRGTTTISGSTVNLVSASNITCQFVIPSGSVTGTWNVTVINTDGQSGSMTNGFSITNTTTTTQTTTTTTTAPPTPTVNSILPVSATTGATVNITNLAGSNLLNITSVKLTRSGQSDISATNVTVVSGSQVTCTFNLASAVSGLWNVMVTNSAGQSGIGSDLFTVNPMPPVASFSGSPLTGAAPLNVTFIDLSTGSPTTWVWSFGDGDSTNATVQNPIHTYSTSGTYSVDLMVSNTGGSTNMTRSAYISVI